MSPEEVTQASAASASDSAPAEAKPVRRKRTTKKEESPEQQTLLADVPVPIEKPKVKRAPRTKKADAETTAEATPSAHVESAPVPAVAPKTEARKVVVPKAEAPRTESPVTAPTPEATRPLPEMAQIRETPREAPPITVPIVTPIATTVPSVVASAAGRTEERPVIVNPPVIVTPPVPENRDFESRDNRGDNRENGTGAYNRPFRDRDNRFNRDNRDTRDNRNNRNYGDDRPGFENRESFNENRGPANENGAPQGPQNQGDGGPNTEGDGFRPQNGEGPNTGGEGNFNRDFDDDRGYNNRFRGRNQLRRERMNNRNGRFGPNDGGFVPPPPRRREFEILGLQEMGMEELVGVAGEFSIESPSDDKEALIYSILEAQAHSQNAILKRGTLEILPDGKGFLRCEGYLSADGDVYVSQSQIKRFNLKTGDMVLGTVRTPKEMERFHGLLRVEAINGLSPEVMKTRKEFEKLTPIFPTEKFVLETEPTNITARIIDLVSPIGKGSRGLIVAPPKAGKTTLIKNVANSIAQNHPEVILIVLLIDERPEEVTDISRSIKGEVVASTFDEMPENHMRVADMVMEKAKRMVEMKQDVVILMDSITRLSRASNLVVTPSGRTLSGGLDPAAMYRPKRMFGAARNIEEGGSLTILATALVDTGSRMDEMIFEEFKGTGNLDLVLDRNLFDQRIFPAIDINRSGTRRDDLLLNKEDLGTVYHLRRTLAQLDNDKAVTLLIDRLKNTKSNLDFMNVVAKSARNAGNGAG